MTQTGCFRSDVPRQIETETKHARTREQDRIVKSEILHLGFARRSKEHKQSYENFSFDNYFFFQLRHVGKNGQRNCI